MTPKPEVGSSACVDGRKRKSRDGSKGLNILTPPNARAREDVGTAPSILDKPLTDRPQWQAALDAANAAPRCGAKRRDGGSCRKAALANGSGRCRLHGGASLRGKDHPGFKHGERSKEAIEERAERAWFRRCLRAGRWV